MTDQPTPQTEAGRRLLAIVALHRKMFDNDLMPTDSDALRSSILAIEAEALAQAHTEALDVDALAEALHDAMCDVSHHDRRPARCSRWVTYPSIARSVVRRYKADR